MLFLPGKSSILPYFDNFVHKTIAQFILHIGTELTFRYKKIVNVLAYILVIVDILGVRKS